MFHELLRWNRTSIAKWEHTRAAGRKPYVWWIGILGWGGPIFLVMTPILYVQQYGATWPSVNDRPILLIVFSALVWLIGSYRFAIVDLCGADKITFTERRSARTVEGAQWRV
jgi:hypothetical protein